MSLFRQKIGLFSLVLHQEDSDAARRKLGVAGGGALQQRHVCTNCHEHRRSMHGEHGHGKQQLIQEFGRRDTPHKEMIPEQHCHRAGGTKTQDAHACVYTRRCQHCPLFLEQKCVPVIFSMATWPPFLCFLSRTLAIHTRTHTRIDKHTLWCTCTHAPGKPR